MRKKKLVVYSLVSVLGLSLLGGATVAQARGMFFGNATPEEIATRHQEMFGSQAGLLGISVDKVKDAWAQGQTLEELAVANGITAEQLQEKMQAERKVRMQEHMQTLVSQGVITQAQADKRFASMEEMQGQKGGRGMGKGMHRGVGLGF